MATGEEPTNDMDLEDRTHHVRRPTEGAAVPAPAGWRPGRLSGRPRAAGIVCDVAASLVTGLVVVAALGMAPAEAGPAGAASSTPSTVRYAEAAGQAPNFIFPFVTLAHFSTANMQQFQYLMYRPLYWFGTAHSVTLDERLSLAGLPAFSDHDRVVTIHLQPYRWSDGERVDARDVLFWLNIWHVERRRDPAWIPGGLSIPTNVKAVRLEGPSTVELELKHSVNPTWFLYNQLSTITPLPIAWTRTSAGAKPGSAGCAYAAFGTGDAACTSVYDFLSEQSGFNPTKPTTRFPGILSTFASNPLWKVVDGPWRLESYGATAPAVFVPNRRYSGPNKPRIAEFVEQPFTSTTAELHALEHGSVDVGYLPGADVRSPTAAVVARRYRLHPVYPWEIRFFNFNFDSTGDAGAAGAIFSQLYVRQAMQLLVDQPALIKTVGNGYGSVSDGPVPLVPRTPFLSKVEREDPYSYDPHRAVRLLRSHGWSVTPGGTDVCERPGAGAAECGEGVPAGAKLALTITNWLGRFTSQMHGLLAAELRSWGSAGIHVTSITVDESLVGPGACNPGRRTSCKWEITAARTWIYVPDLYPSGEEIFSTTPQNEFGANYGLFVTKRNIEMIKATDTTKVTLHPWENYIATQLPLLFEPVFVQEFSEIYKSLHAAPPGPLGQLTPATWWWKR
jgi:peptide/nickel transport system substrate-binding protein